MGLRKIIVGAGCSLCAVLLLLVPKEAYPEIDIGDGVSLGDSLEVLRRKVSTYCTALNLVSVEKPKFPLAESREQHLLCDGYAKSPLSIGKIAFTLGDGQLVHVEAIQVDVEEARAQLGTPMGEVLGIELYDSGAYWLNEARQTLIWASPEGRHLNLFAWHNGFLDDLAFSHEQDVMAMPQVADFTRPLSRSAEAIEASCAPALIAEQRRVWLPNEPAVQVQADCFNYLLGGFPRKLELVYGDDQLQVVWVLTAKPEEQRLRDLLTATWGAPVIDNEIWEVYSGGKISLRKDKPELLLLSEEMIPHYMEDFVTGN